MDEFPPDMPADCPLPGASPCDCTVYRGCATSPPQETDFETHAELGRALNAKGDNFCKRFGLSVFPTKEACEHMLELLPQNGTYVAVGTLFHGHGVILDTPSSKHPKHRTWWPYEGIKRSAPFV